MKKNISVRVNKFFFSWK